MTQKTIFTCDVCGFESTNQEEVELCQARHVGLLSVKEYRAYNAIKSYVKFLDDKLSKSSKSNQNFIETFSNMRDSANARLEEFEKMFISSNIIAISNIADKMKKAERIIPRLKDLTACIQNKALYTRIFFNDKEINYEETADYRNYRICNLDIGEEDGELCFMVYLTDDLETTYIPHIEDEKL